MASHTYRAFLFDLDGTLLDTLPDLVALTNAVMTECGCPTHTQDEVSSYVGGGARVLLQRALPQGSTESQIDHALDLWKKLYPVYGYELTKPYDHVVEALRQLKERGAVLGVLSNKFDAGAQEVIADYFPGLFDIVRGEGPDFPRKPDPCGLNKMMALLGVAADETVYIGDSGSDAEVACNAGVLGVGVSWGYRSVESLVESGAHMIIDDLRELVELCAVCERTTDMTDVAAKMQEWAQGVTDPELAEELAELQKPENAKAAEDAFFQDLSFGTAGLRGIIGVGPNCMNIYTVGRATQGFADYLNAHFENPSVAIGRDSRLKGEEFVRRAAEVFAANGVKVWVYPRVEPVPSLSWAVRDLKASGGVCVTASHNPSAYNGYKAYGADGCQITTQASKDISAAIEAVDIFNDVKSIPFDEALEAGSIAYIGDDVLDRYIDAVAACSYVADAGDAGAAEQPLKLVYTPLNGSGLELVERILSRINVTDVTVVPEQAEPDGNFPTCPYPNPEIREAMQRGIDLCEEVHPDLLVATDPDADRVGIAVKDGDDYILLTGNETGILLLDYVARSARDRGEDMASKVAVTTIVSSVMVDALAAEYGFELRRVLTGFKYIGEIIGQLEAEGQEDRYLFGFEESYGYLSGTHVRDKDGVNATMLICEMARYYKQQGKNLAQAMRDLYERYGFYRNKTNSFSYPGAEGASRMKDVMAKVRASEPEQIAGLALLGKVDYQEGIAGLPPANVVEFDLEDNNKLIVRPSGTEPKIKAYLFAKGDTNESAADLLARLEQAAEDLLN